MQKLTPWVQRRRTPKEDEEELAKFLAQGGKIVKLKDAADSSYDKNLKKIESTLISGFNPFSKEDSLRVK